MELLRGRGDYSVLRSCNNVRRLLPHYDAPVFRSPSAVPGGGRCVHRPGGDPLERDPRPQHRARPAHVVHRTAHRRRSHVAHRDAARVRAPARAAFPSDGGEHLPRRGVRRGALAGPREPHRFGHHPCAGVATDLEVASAVDSHRLDSCVFRCWDVRGTAQAQPGHQPHRVPARRLGGEQPRPGAERAAASDDTARLIRTANSRRQLLL